MLHAYVLDIYEHTDSQHNHPGFWFPGASSHIYGRGLQPSIENDPLATLWKKERATNSFGADQRKPTRYCRISSVVRPVFSH
jgi:hypothetical protein